MFTALNSLFRDPFKGCAHSVTKTRKKEESPNSVEHFSVDHIQDLIHLLQGARCIVLSGAGCSTESGIPDYRGPLTRHKARNPIQFKAFISEAKARQRYWSRSVIGWQRVADAVPNAAHIAIAQMEAGGLLNGVITQNVDRLHHKAGSRQVVELHGTLSEVCCLSCQAVESRVAFQDRLKRLNPHWKGTAHDIAPDGDAEVDESQTHTFGVPVCNRCGGTLKPNVVFFGENVPKNRVEAAWSLYDAADVLLVVGSSLAVYSGYRFVLRAKKEGKPIAIVNMGTSRGDEHAQVVVNESVGSVMPQLADALLA